MTKAKHVAVMQINVSEIEVRTRVRPIKDTQVAALVASITEVGLLNPITITPKVRFHNGKQEDAYKLVAGAHRLEAIKRMGLAVIEATVVELGEYEQAIAECDENLFGTNLGSAERAMLTDHRKTYYELLHPETVHGAVGGGHDKQSRQLGDSGADRFTTDTADKTNRAERSVQRDAERGEKIMPAAMTMIIDTKLDTGTFLDEVKRLPNGDQVAFVKRRLKAPERKKSPPKKVVPKEPKVKFVMPAKEQFEDLKRAANAFALAWDRAGPDGHHRYDMWVLKRDPQRFNIPGSGGE